MFILSYQSDQIVWLAVFRHIMQQQSLIERLKLLPTCKNA